MHLQRNHIAVWNTYARAREQRDAMEEQNCQEDLAHLEKERASLEEEDKNQGRQNYMALEDTNYMTLGNIDDIAQL